jgi:hypothetical protein
VAALGEALSFLIAAGKLLPGTSIADSAREGWLLFYVFHHVGIEVQSATFALPAHVDVLAGLPHGSTVDATIALALIGGTAFAVWMLYHAGRGMGGVEGGPAMVRGLSGARVAVSYALLSWGGSWALSFRPPFPDTSALSLHPSHVSSLFWPLATGLAAGFAGGVRSPGPSVWTSEWWQGESWNRRWRGALSGGWWMLVVAAAASFAALVGLAVARPHDTAAYFRLVSDQGPAGTVAMVVLTALAVPNMAVLTLIPAMGGCLEATGTAVYQSYCFLGYSSFAGHSLGGIPNPSGYPSLGSAPPAFSLFLLVPLVAVLLGGVRAARRAPARSRAEAAAVGSLAGVVFGAAVMVAAILATITARFNGPLFLVSTGYWRFGPNPATAAQLGLAWGLAGGALGGWLGWRRPRSVADG